MKKNMSRKDFLKWTIGFLVAIKLPRLLPQKPVPQATGKEAKYYRRANHLAG